MTDFALATVTEFCQYGSISEINSAILLYRQVIHTRKPSDSKSLFSMYRLAGALALRWFHNRRHGDLDEAVSLLQDCLRLPPAIQPDQPQPHSRLCACLVTRFLLTGQTNIMIEAAHLHRPQQESYNTEEKGSLMMKQVSEAIMNFESSGNVADLHTVISLFRESLVLFPTPHPHHSVLLNNLANTVLTRFQRTGQ